MIMKNPAILAVTTLLAVLAPISATADTPPPPEVGPDAPADTTSNTQDTPPALDHSMREIPDPREVSFRLRDGVRITGRMTAWSIDELDGSFGRRRWTDLHRDDAWKLFRWAMDDTSAQHWAELGRAALFIALDQPGASRSAEQAFRRAVRIDEKIQSLIDSIRDEVHAERVRRAEQAAAAEAQRLATVSPEARDWPASPWP